MKISTFFISIALLVLYGFVLLWIFHPINVNNYHTPESQLLTEYDYIVVGAGSAGSVIASRLAHQDHKVLLLEAGVSDLVEEISIPSRFITILTDPRLSYLHWGDATLYQKEGKTYSIPLPRAKVVGGCGSINAMIWNKGSHRIYDMWEEMGAKGWKYSAIQKYFQKAESTLWIEKEGRYFHQSMRDLADVAKKIYGSTETFNEKTLGFSFYDTVIRNGRRWSSSDAYLKPTLRKYKNLHLQINSTVSKILFNEEKTRAVQVEMASGRTFKAKKEIIVSAGAIQSPVLLMRSGIGEAQELSQLGIPIIKNLPGVGKHLQDHPTTQMIYRTKEPQWISLEHEPATLPRMLEFMITGSPPFSSNAAEVGGYIQTKFAQFKDVEDIQYHCLPLFYGNADLASEKQRDNITDSFISCIVTIVTARDQGSLHLKSAKDPSVNPEIKVNYLDTQEDMKSFVEGMEAIEKIFESSPFKGKVELYFPKKDDMNNKELLKNYIYRSLTELYHPTGTCKMGDVEKDEMAVVDEKLRVKGFENLRVIDASVMPEIVNSNTNAPTIMIAEKGADLILNSS